MHAERQLTSTPIVKQTESQSPVSIIRITYTPHYHPVRTTGSCDRVNNQFLYIARYHISTNKSDFRIIPSYLEATVS